MINYIDMVLCAASRLIQITLMAIPCAACLGSRRPLRRNSPAMVFSGVFWGFKWSWPGRNGMKHGSKIIYTPFWDGWVGPWLTKKSFGAIFSRKFATSTSQHEVEAQDWWQCPWLRTWVSWLAQWNTFATSLLFKAPEMVSGPEGWHCGRASEAAGAFFSSVSTLRDSYIFLR